MTIVLFFSSLFSLLLLNFPAKRDSRASTDCAAPCGAESLLGAGSHR